jgi:hypothetical protein
MVADFQDFTEVGEITCGDASFCGPFFSFAQFIEQISSPGT